MSSETSTDTTFRPWHLFTLAALLTATVGIVVARPEGPAGLVLMVIAIGAAGAVGLGLYRTLFPLAAQEFHDPTEMVGGRTRAALEREKTLVLRAIKELEFDRAMGKVSEYDFAEMSDRLRARAISVMRQLDIEIPSYRDEIERELAERLNLQVEDLGQSATEGSEADHDRTQCAECGTSNEGDAKFCKGCGAALQA